jgi:hypothetical protein
MKSFSNLALDTMCSTREEGVSLRKKLREFNLQHVKVKKIKNVDIKYIPHHIAFLFSHNAI